MLMYAVEGMQQAAFSNGLMCFKANMLAFTHYSEVGGGRDLEGDQTGEKWSPNKLAQ